MLHLSLTWISAFAMLACMFAHAVTQESQDLNVERSDFSNDFVFGIATAAIQIEGGTKVGGKGQSVWDKFVEQNPDKSIESSMQIATDSYMHYKEDVLATKNLGVDAYRFSIPWTRILPNGTLSGGINQQAIDHYNVLIDELVKNGIKPFVTIFHFDSPEVLETTYGGFLNRTIVEDFKNYAEICFKAFGDRVKNWITMNEPLIIAKLGYTMGLAPPGRCSDRTRCSAGNSATEPYIATHNMLLAHARVVKLYKQKYQASQGGQIGINVIGQHVEPYSNTSSDRAAAERAMDFELGWFIEPLVRGKYPQSMSKLVKDRLPTFTAEEEILIKGSFDFVGISYYTARYAKDIPIDPKAPPVSYIEDQHVNITVYKDGVPIGPNAGGSVFVYIYEEGLYKILQYMQKTYDKKLPIVIFENGVPQKKDFNIPIQQTLDDDFRIEFIQKHLQQLHKAIKDGANVNGYFYWSLLDDFEWNEGFTIGFGFYYVDYRNNFNRIPKKSVKWFHDFLEGDKK